MRKKVLTLLLSSVIMAASISGCGASSTPSSGDGSSSEEQKTDAEDTSNEEQKTDAENTSNEEQKTDAENTSNEEQNAAAEDTSNEEQKTDAEDTPNADNSEKVELPSTYAELIDSLHAGQSYAYAPIYGGEDALLVTSYAFDDLEGHQATYEATIFIEKSGSVSKVTTVQSGGTAYPIAVAKDNSLILSMRNSVQKAYIDKETGEFVITDESNIKYTADEEDSYHNYTNGSSEVTADSSLYDELSEEYLGSEILNFESAGISSDGTPNIAGAVYTVYSGEDLYKAAGYMVFDNDTSGHTQTADGISGIPFEYELKVDDITFHFGSADDTSEAKFSSENHSYPTLTFSGDGIFGSNTVTLSCIGNADPETFDATTYYDNDNNLYMKVKSFDEKTLTGDLYREEKISKEYVENAEEGSNIYSVNGTQFTVMSFEDVNKEISYSTDEEFKKDVVGTNRFDGFLVKCSDDEFYYALEKEDYAEEYNVVSMMEDSNLKKLIQENVTFRIKENCEMVLLRCLEDPDSPRIEEEYLIGREFKGDNYPGWSDNKADYYMTSNMLVALGVIDNELYTAIQIYVP